MTQREKILAGAVAGTAVLWGAMRGLERYRAAVTASDNLKSTAESALDDDEFAVLRGERAKRRLIDWGKRSLPTDRDVAESLYQDWVRSQVVAAGLPVEDLADKTFARREEHFGELSLELRTTGTLEQLTDFLYKFYSAPHLHRISAATLTSAENGQKLTAVLGIDALILPDSPRSAELATGEEQKLPHTVDEFKTSLNSRNMFAPHTAGGGPDAGLAGRARFSTTVSVGDGGYQMWVTTENPNKTHKFKRRRQDRDRHVQGHAARSRHAPRGHRDRQRARSRSSPARRLATRPLSPPRRRSGDRSLVCQWHVAHFYAFASTRCESLAPRLLLIRALRRLCYSDPRLCVP